MKESPCFSYGETVNKQEAWLSYRRKNQVNNYLNKAARYIVNFCLSRKIGTIVVGYNPTLKQKTKLGKRNNQTAVAPLGETTGRINCAGDHRRQPLPRRSLRSTRSLYPSDRRPHCLNFVQIPIFTLRAKLKSLCERSGLNYVEQEESYTSIASSLDRDEMPIYNADNPVKPKFSGRRVKRGLYKTAYGHLINALLQRKFKYRVKK